MKLSPIYTRFLTDMVGISVSKAMLVGLSVSEQSMLLCIAIHQATSPEDSVEIMIGLQNYGNAVHGFWDAYVQGVKRHNETGQHQAEMSVNELMERMRDGQAKPL